MRRKFEFFSNNKKEVYTTLIVCGVIIFSAVLWSIGYNLATNNKDVVVASSNSGTEEENENKVKDKEEEKSTKEEEVKSEEEDTETEENKETEENVDEEENNSENIEETQEDTETTNEEEISEEEIENLYENVAIENPNIENEEEEQAVTHEHIWENIIEDVYHKEEGHYEDVLVKEEVVTKTPIYEMQTKHICNTCNADITNSNIQFHIQNHKNDGTDKGGYRTEARRVQVDTKEEVTPAVYEKKWIVDKKAWTEEKVVGKKCKTCGEVQ